MYKYACLNPIARVGLEGFNGEFEATENTADADIILVRSAKMHDMEVSDKLYAVARAGAGVNNIPHQDYAGKGIVVFNTPGANANGVKELVIAGMLLAARDIVGGIEWVKSEAGNPEIGAMAEKQKKKYAGSEISGKTLGIIGLGAIGQLVANAAVSLGMNVYGYDPYISVNAAWNLSRSVKHIEDINEIYKNSDYITIHVPLTDGTKQMINAEAFETMKDGAVLLNFARDTLVDEDALLKALEAGKVRKYVTDFANAKVTGAPNTLVIPHLGASTAEAEDNCAKMAVKQISDYMLNGNITNSVNYPDCTMGVCTAESRIGILHKNVTNMISSFTTLFGGANINIPNLINKSKGDYAYTLVDLDSKATDDIVKALSALDGVIRVRVIK